MTGCQAIWPHLGAVTDKMSVLPSLAFLAFVYCPLRGAATFISLGLLSTYYVVGIMLGTGETAGNQADMAPAHMELLSREGNDTQGDK